jgi:hypothetical protein
VKLSDLGCSAACSFWRFFEENNLDNINDLAAALAKAQAEMSNPKFDSQNPHFKNKFASLAAVRNAIVPAFSKNGLSLLQNLVTTAEGVACETIILHSSGQSLKLGPLLMPAMKHDAQGLGSAATYARRYSLLAAAGVVGEEDDDAEAAVKTNGKDPHITEKQLADLDALIEEVGADKAKFLKYLRLSNLADLPAKAYSNAVKDLEAKRGRVQ